MTARPFPRWWSWNVALARTILALGGLGTLLFSSVDTLIRPAAGADYPYCQGASSLSAWCFLPTPALPWVRFATILILALVASGWRPRVTAIPLWYVLFSNQASLTTIDGGDQIAAVLALFLIPASLVDDRRWHWSPPPPEPEPKETYTGAALALVFWALKFQVAFIYLNACLSKLSVPEWIDGTAVYYWLRDPMFGPAGGLRALTDAAMVHGPAVAAFTWGTLVLEFLLGIAIVLPPTAKKRLFIAAAVFHLGIALVMGLWSFAFTMWAALLIYLWPEANLWNGLRSSSSVRSLTAGPARKRRLLPQQPQPEGPQ
jgi:antimicrobial peptide system SdpB family protein